MAWNVKIKLNSVHNGKSSLGNSHKIHKNLMTKLSKRLNHHLTKAAYITSLLSFFNLLRFNKKAFINIHWKSNAIINNITEKASGWKKNLCLNGNICKCCDFYHRFYMEKNMKKICLSFKYLWSDVDFCDGANEFFYDENLCCKNNRKVE